MGMKKRNTFRLNWNTTTPVPYNPNVALSGALSGVMSATNTIYSNIMDISNTDNQGIELTYTGTPTGTISVLCSESGTNFYPLTFNPVLTQPSGGAGGYLINLNQVPWRYVMIQYINTSGTGSLVAWLGQKDVN